MFENYIGLKKDDLWNRFLRGREKIVHERRHRENVVGLINLLSQYLSGRHDEQKMSDSRLYGHLCKERGIRPYGYTVSIAVEMLPGIMKKKYAKHKK